MNSRGLESSSRDPFAAKPVAKLKGRGLLITVHFQILSGLDKIGVFKNTQRCARLLRITDLLQKSSFARDKRPTEREQKND